MDVGILGLGRIGSGVAGRLLAAGHHVAVYNRTYEKTRPFAEKGAVAAATVEELVAALPSPRILWLYLPAGEVTEAHIAELLPLLGQGDTLIDGGNSDFRRSLAMGARLAEHGVAFIDVGTSGGLRGATDGYCLMMGGDPALIDRLAPLWEAVAQPQGYARVGEVGAGHYTKMVHNAIEYGMMQAYGEGAALLEAAKLELGIDLPTAATVWQHGSIVRSFLGDLLAEALRADPALRELAGPVGDSGEGRWAVREGVAKGIPIPVLTSALYMRFSSQETSDLDRRVLNALRLGFGGHTITPS